jgi:O-antigen/teichoic acid export membrane protein
MLERVATRLADRLAARLWPNSSSEWRTSSRILTGSGLLAVGRIVDLALNAIGLALVARALGPIEFGTLGFATAAAAFVYTLTDLGLTRAYVHRIAGGGDLPSCVSTYFLLRGALLAAACVATITLARWAPAALGLTSSGASLLITMLGVWSLRALATVGQVTLESQQRIVDSQTVVIAYSGIYVLIVPAVAWFKGDAQSVAVANLVPAGLALLLGLAHLRNIGFGRPRTSIAREYAGFAFPLVAGASLNSLAGVFAQTLLQVSGGPASVGYYTAAQRFILPITGLWGAASNFVFASVVRGRVGGHRLKEVAAQVRRADAAPSLVLAALISPLVVDSRGLIGPVLGEAYLPAASAVALLALQAWADSTNFSGAALWLGAGGSGLYGATSIVLTVLLIGLLALSVPTRSIGDIGLGWGLAGAAASAAVVAWLGLIATEFIVHRLYRVPLRIHPLLYLCEGLAIASLVSRALGGVLPDLVRLATEAVVVGLGLVMLNMAPATLARCSRRWGHGL